MHLVRDVILHSSSNYFFRNEKKKNECNGYSITVHVMEHPQNIPWGPAV